MPGEFYRAWLWTLALDEATRLGLRPKIRGLQAATYGFVETNDARVRLAAIYYVGHVGLMQAAPLFVRIDGHKFPVVVRPRFRDVEWHEKVGFQNGVVTCRGRLGKEAGVLTAAHVAAPDSDKFSIRGENMVPCDRQGATGCEHRVLAADPVMDAALVEDNGAQPNQKVKVIKANPYPGYFPIEIETPLGRLRSVIGEVQIAQGVVPGELGRRPNDPALLFCEEPGEPGWSGAMVYERLNQEVYGSTAPPQPYCMFLGARVLRKGGCWGKLNMLRQLEIVWGLELLKSDMECDDERI